MNTSFKNSHKNINKVPKKYRPLVAVIVVIIGIASAFLKNTDAFPDFNNTLADVQYSSSDLNVSVLDVGQGLSILIECDGEKMLYDGGDKKTSNYVVSYLEKHNCTSFKYIIASHYDSDHIAGLIGVLNKYNTEHFIGPNYTHKTKLYTSLMNNLDKRNIILEHPTIGSSFNLGSAKVTVLGPRGTKYSDVNNYSIVLKITTGDKSVLITGDAEGASIAELMSANVDLKSDVYIVGHHGSNTSTNLSLLNRIKPNSAIISCGTDNSYKHPHSEVLNVLESEDIDIFRTDLQGEINFSIKDNEVVYDILPSK